MPHGRCWPGDRCPPEPLLQRLHLDAGLRLGSLPGGLHLEGHLKAEAGRVVGGCGNLGEWVGRSGLGAIRVRKPLRMAAAPRTGGCACHCSRQRRPSGPGWAMLAA